MPSLLHLVLTNDEHTVSNIMSLPLLGKSDHIVIEFVYLCYCTVQRCNVPRYLYWNGDYESMKHELLNTNWEQIFENLNMQCMWSVFHSKVLLLIDKYIPTRIFKSYSKPKWLDSSTLKLIKQKHKAWNT